MNKENKEKLKFRDLPSELINYFLVRLILCGAGYILILFFSIFSGLIKESLFMGAMLTFYASSVLLLLWQAMNDKIVIYEGVYEKKKGKEYSLKGPLKKTPFFTVWSYSSITIAITVDDIERKFQIPCGYSFSADEGNIIRVYTKQEGIYKKNDNTFVINNPILIKIAKS